MKINFPFITSLSTLAAFAFPTTASAQVTLIGGTTKNGNFEATAEGGVNSADRSFGDTADWTNAVPGGTQTIQATRTGPANLSSSTQYPGASGGHNSVVSENENRWPAVATEHTVAAVDFFNLSYHWIDAFNWADESDQIVTVFYTTDDDTVTGTIVDTFEILSGTSTTDATYEEFSQTGITLPSEFLGKILFVKFHGRDGNEATTGFARVDDFELVVVPPEPLYEVSSPPNGLHFLPGGGGEIKFSITNIGENLNLDITEANFVDNLGYSLSSPDLPASIAIGETLEFTVSVDGSAQSSPGDISTTLDLTTTDPIQSSQSLDLSARAIPAAGEILIDYNDGIPGNTIHDASIRNGGFEDGSGGQTFTETPFWASRFTPEGDTTPLTLNSDPATGLLHGQASGFGGVGDRAQPTQTFSFDEWTLQENDVFEVEVDIKAGANYSDPSLVQIIIEVIDANGNLVNDPVNGGAFSSRLSSVAQTVTNSASYQTYRVTSNPIPAGSPWIGSRPLVRVIKNGDRNTFINVDNIYLRGLIDLRELEITSYQIDASTGQVTLRWKDAGYPSYKIQGDADLDFSSDTLELPLDGSEDTSTYPGEIEFTFTDPTGGSTRFWRVSAN